MPGLAFRSPRTDLSADLVSVDVEDYFHLFIDAPETWGRYAVRLETGTERTLDLLRVLGVRATFFILGDAARRSPESVRRIAAAGHEIASHGFGHQLVYRLGRDRFREDMRRGLDALQDITGAPVAGFRASSFSVTVDTPWFWDEVAAAGFAYSSSLHPVMNPLYGRAPRSPRVPYLAGDSGVVEVPVPPARYLGMSLPFSGGLYLRTYPRILLRAAAAQVRRTSAVHWYFHTWELDPQQPRLPLSPAWRIARYLRLGAMEKHLRSLLANRPTETVGEFVNRFLTEHSAHA